MSRSNMKFVIVENRKHPFVGFARFISALAGRPISFIIACIVIIAWLVTGPYFHYSDTWQLMINTSTTIVTFLMVFLIQNTQNRDSIALEVKIDELIRSDVDAHNALLDLEHMSEEELTTIKNRYRKLAENARENLRKGKSDTGSPKV